MKRAKRDREKLKEREKTGGYEGGFEGYGDEKYD